MAKSQSKATVSKRKTMATKKTKSRKSPVKSKTNKTLSWSVKKSPISFSRKSVIIFALVFGILGAYGIYYSLAATTELAKFEGEAMILPQNTPATSATIISDTSASSGKAMQFKAKVLASGTASLVSKPASNKLVVRAKGTACQGTPQMEVKVNGGQPVTFNVGSSWTDYSYAPNIAAGTTPQVSVEFLNPTSGYKGNSGKVRCSSDLSVDKVTLYEVTADTTITANITVPTTTTPGEIIPVTGGVPVEAKPISSNGVSKVEFFVGGTSANGYRDGTLATEMAAPYCLAGDGGTGACYNWDSRVIPSGTQTTITAYAYDSANVRSAPHTITIKVSNTTTPIDPIPTGGSPSGQAMPVGDLTGWKQIFTEDFPTNVPLGSFPTAVADKWGAYPTGWRDTKGQNNSDPTLGGWYNPEKTVSINNGMMDIWMHTELLDGAKKRLVAAPLPKIKGPTSSPFAGQTYGRYAIRFRVDTSRTTNNFSGYKVAWLLWPDSNKWPEDSEIDFPEGDLRSLIEGYLHKQGATCGQVGSLCGSDQYYAKSGKSFGDWHTAVIEWGPNRGAFYFDGALMTDASGGKSEWLDRIPFNPMHWVLQSETELGSNVPAESTQGHIQIDWVTAWSKI